MQQKVSLRAAVALVERNLVLARIHKLQNVRIRIKRPVRLEEIPPWQILRIINHHPVLVQNGDLPKRHLRDLQPQPGQPRGDSQANFVLIMLILYWWEK